MTALKGLFSHHEIACRLLEKSSFEEAGRVLVNSSANIKSILSAEHPRTLGALFDLIMYLRREKRSEIAILLLRQFAAMASIVLTQTHPLGQICRSLTSLDADQFENVIITAWQSALDRLDSTIGPMHYSALRSRLEYIQMAESIHGLERAEMALRKLVMQCKSRCGLVDSRTLKLLDTLGEILMDQKKYAEAEEIAWEIVINAPRVQPLSKAVDLCVAGLFINARVHHVRGRVDLAEETLQRAINMNMSIYGWKHALTLKYLVYMEEWQMEWGNDSLAAQVKEKRLQALSSEGELL
jgi:tetratricopeptide (TPR) repeat protein